MRDPNLNIAVHLGVAGQPRNVLTLECKLASSRIMAGPFENEIFAAVGGTITSTIHVLSLVPVFFVLMKERALRRAGL